MSDREMKLRLAAALFPPKPHCDRHRVYSGAKGCEDCKDALLAEDALLAGASRMARSAQTRIADLEAQLADREARLTAAETALSWAMDYSERLEGATGYLFATRSYMKHPATDADRESAAEARRVLASIRGEQTDG